MKELIFLFLLTRNALRGTWVDIAIGFRCVAPVSE